MATRKKVKKTKPNTSLKPLKAISEKQTKIQILRTIADEVGLTLKQVRFVFSTTNHLMRCHITKKGSGEFAIPEMALKVVRKTKPATKKRRGRNPATGETIMIAAKPKREVIKIRPLKSLKKVLL